MTDSRIICSRRWGRGGAGEDTKTMREMEDFMPQMGLAETKNKNI